MRKDEKELIAQETEDLKREVEAGIIKRCTDAMELGVQPPSELIDSFLSVAKDKGFTESELSALKKRISELPMKTATEGTA